MRGREFLCRGARAFRLAVAYWLIASCPGHLTAGQVELPDALADNKSPAQTSSLIDVGDLEHRTWTIEDGLPQNSVSAIVQTRDGSLWSEDLATLHIGVPAYFYEKTWFLALCAFAMTATMFAGHRILTRNIRRRNAQLRSEIIERQHVEQKLLDLLEFAPDAIVIVDSHGKIVQVNAQTEAVFGYDRAEILGRPLEVLIPQRYREDHPKHRDRFAAAAVARPMAVRLELRALRKDGSEFPVEISLNPVKTEQGLLVASAVRDITARKRSELEKEKLRERLHESRRTEGLGQLAAGVAHDFNNLLMVLMGRCKQAKNMLPQGSQVIEVLTEAEKAGEKARELTGSLLAFSHHTPINMQPLDICNVVRDSTQLIESSLSSTVDLEVETCTPSLWVSGDGTRLHRLLHNLILNAQDAMPSGGTVTVSVTLESEDLAQDLDSEVPFVTSFACVTVIDSGEGMSPEVLRRVREPFFTTKPRGQGTGLGLAIVQGIVLEHGGRLDISSHPDQGTTVAVRLPCIPAPASGPQEPANEPPGTRGRIAVWSDNPLATSLIASTLHHAGYEVQDLGVSGPAKPYFLDSQQDTNLLLVDIYDTDREVLDGLKTIWDDSGDVPKMIILDDACRSLIRTSLGEFGNAVEVHRPLRLSELARLVAATLCGTQGLGNRN